MTAYAGDLVIHVEDGSVRVGRSPGNPREFFMEGVVNEEGGYGSVTLSEAQLRTLVAYIDNLKAEELA